MSASIITTIVASLIILALGLSLKVAQLSHRLKLLEKAYEASEAEKLDINKQYLASVKKASDLEEQSFFSSGVSRR